MKSLTLFFTIALATFAAACNSGVGGPPPPRPTGAFSNVSLKGAYAFQMNGTDVNSHPISRIGVFTADGMGNITAGSEDVNDGGTINAGTGVPVLFNPAPQSTYAVQANGRGMLTLVDASGKLTFSITLSSSSAGLIVETDGNSTVSGSFRSQTVTTTFSPAYAFDFSGVDLANQVGLSLVGQFSTNTGTTINGGVFDINDGGTLSSQVSIPASTIVLDSTTFGTTFGRGRAIIDGLTFVFYVVDGSNLAVLEEDSSGLTSGFATAQTAVPTVISGLAGSFVLDVGGAASSSGITGPLVRIGRFDASNGTVSNLFLDQNFSGSALTFGGSGSISNLTFTIDPAGSGRGTLGFTDVTTGDLFSYVFYLTSASGGFIQDISPSSGLIADGSLSLQSGTFTAASLAGNYIANWTGFNLGNGFEEDFNAQFALTSAASSNVSGTVDYTELGNNQIVTGAGVGGTFTLTGNGTLGGTMANTLTLQAGGQSFKFNAYLISNNSMVLIGVDSAHVVVGTVIRQP